MNVAGKTVAAVEERGDNYLLVRFTDGTALEVGSWGAYGEESGLDVEELNHEDLRRAALRAQGRREADRVRGWLWLVSDEQRQEYFRVRRRGKPQMTSVAFSKAVQAVYNDAIKAQLADMNRFAFGGFKVDKIIFDEASDETH